jgi:anti-sigma B factor antagonist
MNDKPESRVLPEGEPLLNVYEIGELTVVGFSGRDIPDEVCIAGYREQLLALLGEYPVRTLAFDLTGVKLIPSGMLGLLTSLRRRVDQIELYNPSEDIREVLRITNLDTLFTIKDVPV